MKTATAFAAIRGTYSPDYDPRDDPAYDAWLARVQARFIKTTLLGKAPVFSTDAEGLFASWLEAMPPIQRQSHQCHACQSFVERFGSLVTIDADGKTASILWLEEDAPAELRASVQAMLAIVREARVTGVFLSSETVWGRPQTGAWRHLAITAENAHSSTLLSPHQQMAQKREDFKTVMGALDRFTLPAIEQALGLLESDALYRSEKVIGPARWLQGLHKARARARGTAKANVVWAAVATAPAGFCHPRSSMIGTLLEDLAAGKDFAEVSRSFTAKMNPLQYQRPAALPSAGNIAAGEKIIEKLGLAPALERRIARLGEIPKLWEPQTQRNGSSSTGVFSHLRRKAAAALTPLAGVPPVLMTLDKFSRTVIPSAEAMELKLGPKSQAFIVITAPVNAGAPPILQWDREEARNPYGWYVWHGGAEPLDYRLKPGWVNVSALTRLPARWNESRAAHQGDGIIVLLEGARETRNAGNALFPETLRAELHGVRSTLEAYSRDARMQGLSEGTAIGYDLRASTGGYPAMIRVLSAGRTVEYNIDRWD